MTITAANALFGYFKALYTMNQKTITLCGLDVEDPFHQFEKVADDIVSTIPRLVPYTYIKAQE